MAAQFRLSAAVHLLALGAQRGLGQSERVSSLHSDRSKINLHLPSEDRARLRLCVDQTGERIEDKDINVLHVMANESFAEFAETLQKEIEQETGVKFGILQLGLFAGLTYTEEVKTEKSVSRSDTELLVSCLENKGFITPEGAVSSPDIEAAVEQATPELPPQKIQAVAPVVAKLIADKPSAPVSVEAIAAVKYTETVHSEKTVTYDDAKGLIDHFEKKGYVSKSGKIKDTMKNALFTGTLDLPQKFDAARERFESIIKKADSRPPIRDACAVFFAIPLSIPP